MALHEAGCEVDVVCPRGHSILLTSAVNRSWRYRAFRPLKSLGKAIEQSSPDMVVPCDEGAASHLHQLARFTDRADLKALIAGSLGPEGSFAVTESRAGLHALAERLQVRMPLAAAVESEEQLADAVKAAGLPAFLKADGSSGGTGVRAVETIDQVRRAFRRLSSPPSLARGLKRAAVDRDHSLLPGVLLRRRARVSLQQAIRGAEANCAIFCWRGEVMARITVRVEVTSMLRGPSTVVQRMDHPEIDRATSAIARSLRLSGMFGFDFILEEGTDRAVLIEMNARPTQTSHLALGPGHDLAAAAFAAVTGRPVSPRPAVTRRRVIALFPGELHRDPESRYLESAYHDIPSSEPGLVRVCIRRPSVWKRMLTVQGWQRAKARFRGRVSGAGATAKPIVAVPSVFRPQGQEAGPPV